MHAKIVIIPNTEATTSKKTVKIVAHNANYKTIYQASYDKNEICFSILQYEYFITVFLKDIKT